MKITAAATRLGLNDLTEQFDTAVVLDILRATSTIVTALGNGCRYVIPTAEVEEARALAADNPELLLGGERSALKLPGFHFGNSPLEYTPEAVSGRGLVLTTTNGTGAIKAAAEKAPQVLIGSLLNARATARQLLTKENILLVCAGTNGQFSLDDVLAAGFIIKELLTLRGTDDYQGKKLADMRRQTDARYADEIPVDDVPLPLVMNDTALAAYRLALYYQDNTAGALYDTMHGQKLVQLGMKSDLVYCAQLNVSGITCRYKSGIIST